jgi:uncharacterized protein DUF4440
MTTTADTVRALQDQVNAALLGSDWEKLNDLVSPDAQIIGPRGFLIDRDTWLGVHQESRYQQVRLEPAQTQVQAHGNAGIRIDEVESECRYQGETITGHFRVSQVWAADRGRWQLVALQYTAIA